MRLFELLEMCGGKTQVRYDMMVSMEIYEAEIKLTEKVNKALFYNVKET